MTDIRQIPIKFIRTNGKTQVRLAMDQGAILDYAEAMKEGKTFPPVVLFLDKDIYWLGDGFHRVEAALAAGKKNIKADVRQGGLREAQFFAIGANHDHGLRRTNADRRNAVSLLLDDDQWSAWTDRQIAKQAGVTHPLVAKMRRERVVTVTTPAEEKQAPEGTVEESWIRPGMVVYGKATYDAKKEGAYQVDKVKGDRAEVVNLATGKKSTLPIAYLRPMSEDDPEPAPEPLPVVGGPKEQARFKEAVEKQQALTAPPAAAVPNRVLDAMEELLDELPVTPTTAKVPQGQVLVPIADRARLAQLENLLPQKEEEIKELTRKLEEAGAQVQELNDENQAYARILDAEDLLPAFKKEVVRAQALARTTEERNRGLQNQAKSLERSAKSWKRKFEALERKTKGTTEPDPELPSDESPYPPAEV